MFSALVNFLYFLVVSVWAAGLAGMRIFITPILSMGRIMGEVIDKGRWCSGVGFRVSKTNGFIYGAKNLHAHLRWMGSNSINEDYDIPWSYFVWGFGGYLGQ